MRLVFAGTPAPAVPSLRALAASAHEIAAVITRPDAPFGRRRELTPSPVATVADELGLPIIKAARLDEAATDQISSLEPDLGVIVAYGGLVRDPLLSRPAHGWINLHFSLLPQWRGAAPVQHAIIAGDTVTGAGVFQLVAALDAGDIFDEIRIPVPPTATAGALLDHLATEGAALLARVVDAIADGTAASRPQSGEPTLAPKLTAADGLISWDEPVERVLARIHGTTPEPGAHTSVDGARLKVLAARRADRDIVLAPGRIAASGAELLVGTATAPVALERVQPAGKPAMAAGDWWRGLRLENPVAGR